MDFHDFYPHDADNREFWWLPSTTCQTCGRPKDDPIHKLDEILDVIEGAYKDGYNDGSKGFGWDFFRDDFKDSLGKIANPKEGA